MADPGVQAFFESLAKNLNSDPSRLSGTDCVYQFAIGDAAWHVSLKGGKAAVAKGTASSPQCTVTMAEPDFLALVAGTLNPQMAFMTGKLKVAGDMGLALKLGAFLKA